MVSDDEKARRSMVARRATLAVSSAQPDRGLRPRSGSRGDRTGPGLLAHTDAMITVDQEPPVESLSVAVAGGVAVFDGRCRGSGATGSAAAE